MPVAIKVTHGEEGPAISDTKSLASNAELLKRLKCLLFLVL